MSKDSDAAAAAVAIDGVASVRALVAAGVPRSTIGRRCGRTWRHLGYGVVLLDSGTPSLAQHLRAALLSAGDDALLTGPAALFLHGAGPVPTAPFDVLVPARRRPASSSLVRVHRVAPLPRATTRQGLPVARLPRAARDAAGTMTHLDEVLALFAGLVQSRRVRLADLQLEVGAAPHKGYGLARRAVAELGDGAHSVAEVRAQRLYRRFGLPPMVFNVEIAADDGSWWARPDGWNDEFAVVWEIDSLAHHLSPEDHLATARRRAQLVRAGVKVVSHLPAQLDDEPDVVRADLDGAFRRADARPRPPVHLRKPAGMYRNAPQSGEMLHSRGHRLNR